MYVIFSPCPHVPLQTATLYPGLLFGLCFILNFFIWGKHSSGAVPFTTMLALLCMWFGISLPLVFLGYYFGFRKQARRLFTHFTVLTDIRL